MDLQGVITFLLLVIAVLTGLVSGLISAWLSAHQGASARAVMGTGVGAFMTSTALVIAIMTFARY